VNAECDQQAAQRGVSDRFIPVIERPSERLLTSSSVKVWSNLMLLKAAKTRRMIIRSQKRMTTRIVCASRVKFVSGC
jgi:hypothetical protein